MYNILCKIIPYSKKENCSIHPLWSVSFLLVYRVCFCVHVPSSWYAPACARAPGGNTDAGIPCHLSQASPGHSARCSPPYGNHLKQHTQKKVEINAVMEERRREDKCVLTHVELSNKARHIIVFKVLRQDFLGKASLVKHMKTCPSLKQQIKST